MNIKKFNTPIILLIATAILLLSTIGATLAYLAFKTPEIVNEFQPVAVSCKVEEEFSNGVKSQVKVRNTGDVTAYVRVAIVANWVNDVNGAVLSNSPIEAQDYTITFEVDGWNKGIDGYYYYENPVKSGDVTQTLISNATAINQPDGYSLSLQVLASAIQSEPTKAVEQSWNSTVRDGVLIPK